MRSWFQKILTPRRGAGPRLSRPPVILPGESPRLYPSLGRAQAERLAQHCPEQAGKTLAQADLLLAHQFTFLGSGAFVPRDPDRPGRADYRPVDWNLDPVRNLRFPRGIPHRDWDLYKMRPGSADIKYPWELGRCQHFVTLAQAWLLSGRAAYAKEILAQMEDFSEANPPGLGIQWTCTMDVALRALNWAVAVDMIRDCTDVSARELARVRTWLEAHATFIFGNLENKYEVTSNHFLSNIVGLFYLGVWLDSSPGARAWETFARRGLEKEMEVQVLPDGADYESSVPYHRLVTELFLGPCRLADCLGRPMSSGFRQKLAGMVDFLAGVARPDGRMPQVGDADDGRLHIFTDYGTWDPQEVGHLLGPAARIFDRTGWWEAAGPKGAWEAAWWGFAWQEAPAPKWIPNHRLYPHAGLVISRQGGNYLMISNGVVGTKGFGNHKHNDQLGFELHLAGQPLLADPGSYVYTGDAEARNRFRSTESHNTLVVDGTEQNETKPEWLFRMFDSGAPSHLEFSYAGESGRYRGSHAGYRRLSSPLGHERLFRWNWANPELLVWDRLQGGGEHQLQWNFHFFPGVGIFGDSGSWLIQAGEKTFRLLFMEPIPGQVDSGYYSPSYGVRWPCRVLRLEARKLGAEEFRQGFAMAPAQADPGGLLNRLRGGLE